MLFVSYLLIGAFAGLLAGLFGLGGGLIIVPVLLFVFSWQGLNAEVIVHMAVGTSFASIALTSLSAIWSHCALGNMRWLIVRNMLPGLVFGVLVGAFFAAGVEGAYLQMAIALFLLTMALQMFLFSRPKDGGMLAQAEIEHLPAPAWQLVSGLVIGFLSAFFGIGGGSMTVPYLSHYRVQMHNAVAVSAACGLPIALFGALGYFFSGSSQAALPEFSTGYIYWPAVIGVALAGVPFARLGANFAQKLPERKMKLLFALLLLGIALHLLFDA